LEVAGGLAALESELRKRMVAPRNNTTPTPIYITIEAPDTLNYTIIDAPGYGHTATQDAVTNALAAAPNRHIVAVMRSTAEPENTVLGVLGSIDPELARTTLVYTSFFDVLRMLQVCVFFSLPRVIIIVCCS
jgi:hypothetical protein